MFDYHMHSRVSFDGHDTGAALVQAAERAGLKEICFTDHMDYVRGAQEQTMIFTEEAYGAEYDGLESSRLKIRRGMEYGLYRDNQTRMRQDIARRNYDFILGSVHFVDDIDVYFAPYWQGKTVYQAQRRYFEEMLDCVQANDDFDVLAHMTYLHKGKGSPVKTPLAYADHSQIIDEILRTLAAKGKGLELNTSGVDRCGGYLPTADYFRRFRELGGKIVTVGSDAHTADRVGQYCREGCRVLMDIFGYVCTFQGREPIFHREMD